MTKYSLYVRLEAKPGKEQEVADFLVSALPLVNQEPETIVWFALRMSPNVFGIFDAFPNEQGRDAHLSGEVAKALMAKASDLFATAPEIHKVDVLADKLPGN
jgi:quinol monooxygenase YgiN